MPNHYHFLIRQDGEIPISKFINTLFNAYVQALNKYINRTGTLFEGRFKHVHIDRDEYLIHLIRYIHVNPVEAGIVKNPEDWIFSNYLECINERNGELFDINFIYNYFSSSITYKKFVYEYHIENEKYKELEKYFFD